LAKNEKIINPKDEEQVVVVVVVAVAVAVMCVCVCVCVCVFVFVCASACDYISLFALVSITGQKVHFKTRIFCA
jgi:hypothetical protein